ncbi:hypothetical protein BKA82DRAFT_4148543 [Pisolithus tinctorius]|nr:hypothetical protein BKA82DRAFT_4148543 [Pisolithus tinctorius]
MHRYLIIFTACLPVTEIRLQGDMDSIRLSFTVSQRSLHSLPRSGPWVYGNEASVFNMFCLARTVCASHWLFRRGAVHRFKKGRRSSTYI